MEKQTPSVWDVHLKGSGWEPSFALMPPGTWMWRIGAGGTVSSGPLWERSGFDPHCIGNRAVSWPESIVPEERAVVAASLEAAAAGGMEFSIMWQCNGSNGAEERWLLSTGVPVRDAAGTLIGSTGHVVDVTGLVGLEEPSRSSAGIRSIDSPEDDVRHRITGQSAGIESRQAYLQGAKAERTVALQDALENLCFEFRCRMAGNARRTFNAFDATFSIHSTPHVQLIIYGIRERNRFESLMAFRLRLIRMSTDAADEDLLRAAIDETERLTRSSIGICCCSQHDYRQEPLVVCSTRTMTDPGVTGDIQSALARHARDLCADAVRDSRPFIRNDSAAGTRCSGFVHGNLAVEREMIVPHMSGNAQMAVFCVGNSASDYTREDAEQMAGLVSLACDIITRRRAAEAAKSLEADRRQSQKMQMVGQMASGIAHDINNMLTVTLGNVDMLLEQVNSNHPFSEGLQAILGATRQSAALTGQLLALSRKQDPNPSLIELNQIIEEYLPMLKVVMGRRISCIWNAAPGTPRIRVDRVQMGQILVNLCLNARDAISRCGTLTIRAFERHVTGEPASIEREGPAAGDYAVITLTDTGCGIDSKNLPHIFKPFFTTGEAGKGTGLGLWNVHRIVTENHGHIHCSSRQGEGTTFSISFPLSAEPEDVAEPAFSSAAVVAASRHEQPVILLVEDDQNILVLLKMVLEAKGYRVHTAPNAETALAMQGERIDLLLSDVVMPGMNGIELCARMKGFDPGRKCLFMSGCTPHDLHMQGVLHEGVNFIYKPFAGNALAALVHQALMRHDGAWIHNPSAAG